jgi:hypothetical protein
MDKESKKNLEEGFKKLFNSSIILKKQRINKENKKKQLFISFLNEYEETLKKSFDLSNQFKIDLYEYEEGYFSSIDKLMLLMWGESAYDVISYYLYDRFSLDGSLNVLYEQQEEGPDKEIILKNPEDLYNYLIQVYPDFLK